MKAGWQIKFLGDVAEVGAGNSAPQDEHLFVEGIHPFFRTSDVGRIHVGTIYEAADYLNDEGIKGLRQIPKCAILFPKSGASTFLNHRVMLGVEGFVSSHLATIVADKTQIDPRFLLYFLTTISAQDMIQDHAYPSLNLPSIAGIRILVPPLSEQQRMVGILDKAFEGIATVKANTEKNLQNTRALFQSHLQAVFTERSKVLPVKPLGGLCEFSQGIQVDVKAQSKIKKGEAQVRFLRIVDFTQGNEQARYIDNPGTKFLVCSSDISLVRYGASTGFVCSGLDGAIANNLFRVIPKCNDLCRKYLYWFLKSDAFQSVIRKSMNGAAMPAISFGMINDVALPLPSLSDQELLVARLDELSYEIQRLEALYQQKHAALEELKKALLYQAFAGEL
jgi:type I restriction enzyme S subunit